MLSEPAVVPVICHATRARSPSLADLHVVSLGVSKHRDTNLNLRFASKDAADVVDVLQQQEGKLFRNVSSERLLDEEVTSTSVSQTLDTLLQKPIKPQDYVVVFVSGHGLHDKVGQYYFVTHETERTNIAATSVPWTEFQKLRKIDANVLLLVDTCHAGGVAGNEETQTAYNDVLREAAINPGNLITFASCLPHQLSYEDINWKNGAFTKAFVEGMSGKADFNEDGGMSIAELEAYTADRVHQLTSERQSTSLLKSIGIPSTLPMGRS